MNITNGTVEYSRTVRPADYESKNAKVVLSFALDDGELAEQVTARVMDLAVAEVHRRLGLATVVDCYALQPLATVPLSSPTGSHVNAVPELVEEGPPPETISDAKLDAAVHDCRAAGIAPEVIKKIIFRHTGQVGRSMKTLSQTQRPAFVADLKALKKPATVEDSAEEEGEITT